MTREPVVLGWSGGKDSSLALQALRADPAVEVVGLLTTVTREYDRISIHGVRRALLHAQARAAGVPLHEMWLEPGTSYDAYERTFADAALALRERHPGIRRIAFGDLFLEDVRAYRERLLAPLGLAGHFPLWGENTATLARRFVRDGFRARLVCVDTQALDAGFAGRDYDDRLLDELPASVDPCGERGEFHTFVHDGPILARPVPCEPGERVLRDGRFAYCDLLEPAGSAS